MIRDWYNLLMNAIKFTEPGSRIVLTQTVLKDGIWVSVADSGCSDNCIKKVLIKTFTES